MKLYVPFEQLLQFVLFFFTTDRPCCILECRRWQSGVGGINVRQGEGIYG